MLSPGPEHSCPLAASMALQQKSNFSQIMLRVLCTGACVSLVNACVAGECRPGGLRTQSPDSPAGPGPGPGTGALASLEVLG